MSRIAFVFPGQGAQYFGMGKDFYENNSASRAVYDKAGEITGLDIKKLCFEENDKLNITEYTQIALLTTELAMLKAVTQKGLGAGSDGRFKPRRVCSLSCSRKAFRRRCNEGCPSERYFYAGGRADRRRNGGGTRS